MTPEPQMVSWLLLERYALGELQGAQLQQVEQALQSDAQARACLAQIRSDMRVMPPLPTFNTADLAQAKTARAWWMELRFVLSSVAALALVALWIAVPRDGALLGTGTGDGHGGNNVKGDHVAIELVREQAGSVGLDATQFSLGDRFKVRVSCDASRSGFAHVLVQQDGALSTPLSIQAVACGNNVVLDGAFTLDRATAARVCVVLAPQREITLKSKDLAIDVADDDMDCVDLTPTVAP